MPSRRASSESDGASSVLKEQVEEHMEEHFYVPPPDMQLTGVADRRCKQ
jgi:hypothetical protein